VRTSAKAGRGKERGIVAISRMGAQNERNCFGLAWWTRE
jgi:hypothetical protein